MRSGIGTPSTSEATPRDFFCSEGPPLPFASGFGRLPKPIWRSRLTGGRRSRRLGWTPPRFSCSSSSSSVSSSSSISWSSDSVTWSRLFQSDAVGFLFEPLLEPLPAVEPDCSSSWRSWGSGSAPESLGFFAAVGFFFGGFEGSEDLP